MVLGKASRWWGWVVSLLVLGAAAAGQEGSAVVAEINGVKITRAELETQQASKLLQARYQSYVAEQKALDDLIDEHLLQMEAARQQVSVAQLEEREINSKAKEPSEEQLQLYYEDANTSQPYEAVRAKILEQVRQRRTAKARAAYLQQLRSHYDVVVRLAPPAAGVTAGDAPRLGSAQAPVQLIEFADFECPYCIKVQPSVQKLHQEFGDQLAIYFKDLPLPMHKHARPAAEAAQCAGVQGQYWPYHDLLFSGGSLELAQLKQYARQLQLDGERFDACLDHGEQAGTVQKELAEGQQLGLTGTPSFFINGHFLSGAVDYATLREMVVQQLGSGKATAELSPR